MKSKLLLLIIFLSVFSTNKIYSQKVEANAISFVLTDEGNDKLIERLITAGCHNLYEALVYLRNNIGSSAPTALTSRMDTLIDTLVNSDHKGEVFTAPLSDFTGGNSPVGINSDGTFIRADFSIYDYDGREGYQRYKGKDLFTYATSAESYIYMGSNEIGEDTTINYRAFAVAWGDSTITGVADDNNEKESLIISPNPASDYIEINRSEPSEGFKPSEGYISNTLGECVINYELQITNYDNGIKINVSNLPVGVYYLRISNMSCKFIIAR